MIFWNVEEYITEEVSKVLGKTLSRNNLDKFLKDVHGPTAMFQNVERAGLVGVKVKVGDRVAAVAWGTRRDGRLYLRAFLMARHAVTPLPMSFTNGRRRAVVFPNNTVVIQQKNCFAQEAA